MCTDASSQEVTLTHAATLDLGHGCPYLQLLQTRMLSLLPALRPPFLLSFQLQITHSSSSSFEGAGMGIA